MTKLAAIFIDLDDYTYDLSFNSEDPTCRRVFSNCTSISNQILGKSDRELIWITTTDSLKTEFAALQYHNDSRIKTKNKISKANPNKLGKVFTKKNGVWNAFDNPALHFYLTQKNIQNLIIAGLYEDRCVSSTLKAALALGYKVLLPVDATDLPETMSLRDYPKKFCNNQNLHLTNTAQLIQKL